MTREGDVSGINRYALYSSTFPPILKKLLTDPGPLNNKKTLLAAQQLCMLPY
jgi:hypothetical protein